MNQLDSNEVWIGTIPGDWTRSRIKNVASLSPGYSGAPPTPDDSCTVVPMEPLFEDGSLDLSHQERFDDIQHGLTFFEKGDVPVHVAPFRPVALDIHIDMDLDYLVRGKEAVLDALPERVGVNRRPEIRTCAHEDISLGI